jgi:ppGpp synthetase/RelA/SpoT-type nucleotidyltranferase
MRWTTLQYSREQINQAGRLLAHSCNQEELPGSALDVIGNWRACHSWPLNTFKLWLLGKSKEVDDRALVAQRLKRLSSISLKLQRFPAIKLSQMQDIAGCRAVLSTVQHVDQMVQKYKKSDLKHTLIREDDYIREPRSSGYRSIHLIYRYFSDKNTIYNDLKVEVQLRSTLQHAWATAVETVGTFTQQALKSSQGKQEWLRFFELMGTEIAFRERTPLVRDTPTSRSELKDELQYYAEILDVENHLKLYAASLQMPERAGEYKAAKFFLLELDPSAMRLRITGYRAEQLDKASSDYLTVERRAIEQGKDAVLVSVDSFRALKRAFPNYYLDTHRFIQIVKQAVARSKKTPRTDPRQGNLFTGFSPQA